MCGKYMEELVKCREANPVRRFFGECNDVTYKLTKCLAEEKAIARAPRQEKYKENWAAKREADAARMKQLEAEAAARRAAADAAQASATSATENSSSRSGASGTAGGGPAPSGTPSSVGGSGDNNRAGPRVQAASVCEQQPSLLPEWCSAAVQQLGGLPGTLSARLSGGAHKPSPAVSGHATLAAPSSACACTPATTPAPAATCSPALTSPAACEQEEAGPRHLLWSSSQAQQRQAEGVPMVQLPPLLQLPQSPQVLPMPLAKPACSFSWDLSVSLWGSGKGAASLCP